MKDPIKKETIKFGGKDFIEGMKEEYGLSAKQMGNYKSRAFYTTGSGVCICSKKKQCANYPECDFTSWKRPLAERCHQCGGLKVQVNGKFAECTNCGERTPLPVQEEASGIQVPSD